MTMTTTAIQKITLVLLVLLSVPAALLGQGQSQDPSPEGGVVETGGRSSWGDVYGRPDLPFQPELKTSDYDEYRDLRDGFFKCLSTGSRRPRFAQRVCQLGHLRVECGSK